MANEKSISILQTTLAAGLVFLLPIFFLTNLFPNSFITPKLILLIVGTLILAIIQAAKYLITGATRLKFSSLDLPLLALVLTTLASTILKTPNKADAFFFSATASFITFGGLLYFLVNQLPETGKKAVLYALISSASTIALISILHTLGFFDSTTDNLIKNPSFSPIGNKLQAAILLAIISPIAIFQAIKQTDTASKLFNFTLSIFMLLGLFASLQPILSSQPTNQPQIALPPLTVSWSVAIDSIKESPLLGSGTSNYLSAFTRLKPRSYNSSEYWNTRFGSARNYYLTSLTENGLLGLTAIILLLIAFDKSSNKLFKSKDKKAVPQAAAALGVLIIFTILLFFPANPITYIILLTLLSISSTTSEVVLNSPSISRTNTRTDQSTTKLIPLVMLSVILSGTIYIALKGIPLVKAENQYLKAIQQFQANEALNGYESAVEAIKLNHYSEKYHNLLAQTSLAIAQNIAKKEASQITDQDRAQIAKLVQQAINEGKAAIATNPQDAENWLRLGSIYKTVIPFAQGADQFTIAAYSQAIALNPFNPKYRIELGSVYYSLGRYEEAQRSFELAVIAKPDYANSHFNLAVALKQLNKIDESIAQLEATLTLVKDGSEDFRIVKNELEGLEKLRTTKTQQATQQNQPEELTIPSESVEQSQVEVNLPEAAAPPDTGKNPTPSPAPSQNL